jgi:hypothetical protein
MTVLQQPIARRAVLAGLTVAVASTAVSPAAADDRPPMKVFKDPNCGCCSGWATHMTDAGFAVTVVEAEDLKRVRSQAGVPAELAGCHTAEVGGYIVEGHVPAVAVRRLLATRPTATGIAAPGMPMGSPGMESPDPETFEVFLFGPAPGQKQSFGLYRGTEQA